MYRIFILSLLAIVCTTFALESSQIILRATEIRGDSVVLEWSPIEWSVTYKVFYDEESLINPKAPEPILESALTDKTHIEITKMLEGADYYFIVRWYDDKNVEVGETIPLHASTLNIPVFALKDVTVVDDQHISLSFSRPVDVTKTEIEVMNTETKNVRALVSTQSSDQDLRVITLTLKGKLEPGVSHDVVLKKVTNTAGETLPLESLKKTTIVFSSLEKPKEDTVAPTTEVKPVSVSPDTVVDTPAPVVASGEAKSENLALLPLESEGDTAKDPVSINKLPQTGAPAYVFLLIALALWSILSYKKKTSL